MSRAWGPLDEALEDCRRHRLPYRWHATDLNVFESTCPLCRSGGWDLRIREAGRGGPVAFFCSNGCADSDVRTALAAEAVHPQIEAAEVKAAEYLELAEQARGIASRALEQLAAGVTR